MHRADVVPRLSYASVEGAFLDLVNSSPVRNAATSFGRKVTQAFEGLKVQAPGMYFALLSSHVGPGLSACMSVCFSQALY